MSKEKPEVGDVYEIYDTDTNQHHKALVINTRDFIHPYCLTDDFQSVFLCGYNTEEYLGKSKASIEKLFDVADDVDV